MDKTTVAIIVQEGSRLVSELIRLRPRRHGRPEAPSIAVSETDIEEKQESLKTGIIKESEQQGRSEVATGCIPCAIGHFGTCNGLLNESMRFAREDGIGSDEVIDRINKCLDELNAMERIDLSSEKIMNLPPWEKELALKALNESRATRHGLESLTTVDDLERVTVDTQSARMAIGKDWFRRRWQNMSKGDKKKQVEKAIENLEEG